MVNLTDITHTPSKPTKWMSIICSQSPKLNHMYQIKKMVNLSDIIHTSSKPTIIVMIFIHGSNAGMDAYHPFTFKPNSCQVQTLGIGSGFSAVTTDNNKVHIECKY